MNTLQQEINEANEIIEGKQTEMGVEAQANPENDLEFDRGFLAGLEHAQRLSRATNFDIRITRELAEYLLKNTEIDRKVSIMCKEYGMETREAGDKDWVGLCPDDLDENGKLDEDYKTIELHKI